MIRNIVFDFGGVLVDFDPERMIRANGLSAHRELILREVFGSSDWRDMDAGTQTPEAAVSNMLRAVPEELHAQIRHMIFDREAQMPPLTQMTPIIDGLYAAGFRLFVLTNCAAWFHEFKKTIPSIEKFSGFVVSADHGVIKPDPAIFQILLNTFSLRAEECLFIDDAPANTSAAQALGFSVHCFADRDFARLRQALPISFEENL